MLIFENSLIYYPMQTILLLLICVQQTDAPIVDRKLKPKLHNDETESKIAIPTKTKKKLAASTIPCSTSPVNQSIDLRPPCIDRKLKPTTPIKVLQFF